MQKCMISRAQCFKHFSCIKTAIQVVEALCTLVIYLDGESPPLLVVFRRSGLGPSDGCTLVSLAGILIW